MAEVVLDGVSHRYAGASLETLCRLDLSIESGTRHALLGSSGAGKTTLLNLLSGLDVTRSDAGARNVAQVFQFPVLYESLNVAKNLEFPLKTRGFRARERRRRAGEIAERLGISSLLGRSTRGLSLFQKQLVAIGRALVRPDVALVLLDEPLTAVEPATKWQLRRVLKSVQQELGATMIYVTHDQTEALTFADRVSVLHGGRLLQTDTASGLFDDPSCEYVASFIGSPGMNLLPAELLGETAFVGGQPLARVDHAAPGACVIGFRPEWARVVVAQSGAGLPVDVLGTRTLGVRSRARVGIVTARLSGQTISVRQPLDVEPGDRATLRIDRVVAFRDGRRLAGLS